MLHELIIKNVTFAQRRAIKQFVEEGRIKVSSSCTEGFIDNIGLFPHFYFLDGYITGFIHACFFEPTFIHYDQNWVKFPEITFDDLVKKINEENITSETK